MKKGQPKKGTRGERGRTGRQGPRGQTGAWPADAFDLLSGRIDFLQEQLDDVRVKIAEIQEIVPLRRRQRSKAS